jgi:ATP-dependent Clp protease, protease subunit
MSRKTNRLENKTGEATLYLYEEIGFWGIDAAEFVKDLQKIDADTIHLRINSPGGDVFAARTMQTALKQHKAKVIAHIDGLAASAASFIAMGADEVEMVDGGFIMIHKALSFFDVLGYYNDDALDGLMADMAKERELLAKVDDSIAADYAKRTGKDTDEIKAKMAAETWFSADEAKEFGLVDRVYGGKPVENKHDLSFFANVPENLRDGGETMTKRTAEKALRDAGFPANKAKAILSSGWTEDGQRDVATPEPVPQPEAQREVVAEGDKYEQLITQIERNLSRRLA